MKKKKGFTLIELLIVIAIIVIVLGVAYEYITTQDAKQRQQDQIRNKNRLEPIIMEPTPSARAMTTPAKAEERR